MRGIIKHDFYAGIAKNIYKLLAVFVIFLIGALWASKACGIKNVSFSEASIYILCGKEPFAGIRGDGSVLNMPVMWMIIQIYIAYIICSYPTHDLNSYGINLVIRTGSRYKWWFGKIIWCILMNFLIYLVGFSAVMCATGFDFDNMWSVGSEISDVCSYDFTWMNTGEIWRLVIFMPLLTSIAISLLQMFLMFWIKEIAAYGVVLFMFVGGVYYESLFFVSSNSMVIRNAAAYLNGTQTKMCMVNYIVILISVLLGCIVIKRKNVYGN